MTLSPPDLSRPAEIEALRAVAPIKTWSLLVTVFGDRRARPEAPLTGAFLNTRFRQMGIRAEALRVALHRLSKDGWISARKVGRTSEYFLTSKGLQETEAAQAQVYATPQNTLTNWKFAIFEGSPPISTCPTVKIAPSVLAVPDAYRDHFPDALFFDITTQGPPDWCLQKCLSPDLWQEMEQLAKALDRLDLDALAEDPERHIPVRMLALHQWRRLALRNGFWLLRELAPDAVPRTCEARMRILIEKLGVEDQV